MSHLDYLQSYMPCVSIKTSMEGISMMASALAYTNRRTDCPLLARPTTLSKASGLIAYPESIRKGAYS